MSDIDMQGTIALARSAAALIAKRGVEDEEVRALAIGRKMATMLLAEIRAGAPAGILFAAVGIVSQQDTDVMAGILLGIDDALRHGHGGAA